MTAGNTTTIAMGGVGVPPARLADTRRANEVVEHRRAAVLTNHGGE